jgi:hypothetical protein
MPRPSPRLALLDARLFGRDPLAPWHAARDLEEAARFARAYTQHLVSCAVSAELHRTGQTRERLATRMRSNADILRRKLVGEYWASPEDITKWVLILDDVALLPAPQNVAELLPPTMAGEMHQYST